MNNPEAILAIQELLHDYGGHDGPCDSTPCSPDCPSKGCTLHKKTFEERHARAMEAIEHLRDTARHYDTIIRTAQQSARLDRLRQRGLTVAVHNDYRLNGQAYTFWLMTLKHEGLTLAFQGEGSTDEEALAQIEAKHDEALKPHNPEGPQANPATDILLHPPQQR